MDVTARHEYPVGWLFEHLPVAMAKEGLGGRMTSGAQAVGSIFAMSKLCSRTSCRTSSLRSTTENP